MIIIVTSFCCIPMPESDWPDQCNINTILNNKIKNDKHHKHSNGCSSVYDQYLRLLPRSPGRRSRGLVDILS